MEFHSIADEWPLIDGTELESLVASVRQHGVKVPGWKYEGKVLDGRNRYRAATAAGRPMEWLTFEGTEDEARELARLLNDERRHLSKEDRVAWVAKLRAKGMSTRAIADAVGVTQGTVRNDLKSGEQNYSPDTAPESSEPLSPCLVIPAMASALLTSPPKVTGRDGKKYPATKRRAEPLPPASLPVPAAVANTAPVDAARAQKLKAKAMSLANDAINALRQIGRETPARARAFEMVCNWIRDNSDGALPAPTGPWEEFAKQLAVVVAFARSVGERRDIPADRSAPAIELEAAARAMLSAARRLQC